MFTDKCDSESDEVDPGRSFEQYLRKQLSPAVKKAEISLINAKVYIDVHMEGMRALKGINSGLLSEEDVERVLQDWVLM